MVISVELHFVEADEHAVRGAVVGEPGTRFAGNYRPPLRGIRAVVEGDYGRIAEIAYQPTTFAVRRYLDTVGGHAVEHRGVREGRFAAHRGDVELAAGVAGLRHDERVAVLR